METKDTFVGNMPKMMISVVIKKKLTIHREIAMEVWYNKVVG